MSFVYVSVAVNKLTFWHSTPKVWFIKFRKTFLSVGLPIFPVFYIHNTRMKPYFAKYLATHLYVLWHWTLSRLFWQSTYKMWMSVSLSLAYLNSLRRLERYYNTLPQIILSMMQYKKIFPVFDFHLYALQVCHSFPRCRILPERYQLLVNWGSAISFTTSGMAPPMLCYLGDSK